MSNKIYVKDVGGAAVGAIKNGKIVCFSADGEIYRSNLSNLTLEEKKQIVMSRQEGKVSTLPERTFFK